MVVCKMLYFILCSKALFAVMFDEPEDEKEEKREKERYYRVANRYG